MPRPVLLPALTAALLLAVTGCVTAGPEPADDPKPASSAPVSPSPDLSPSPSGTGAPGAGPDGIPLADAISRLTVAPEHTGGYNRRAFKHWNGGLIKDDGCDTRAEVLLAEAVKPPTKEAGCKLTGGEWLSYYDETTVTDPTELDIDHVVPLEEAWSSGAHTWDDERREAYANDLDAPRSLIAVTAKTNRAKGKKDVAEWLPPAPGALCTYLADWTATKLRWGLTADRDEHDALTRLAKDCPTSTVAYEPAP